MWPLKDKELDQSSRYKFRFFLDGNKTSVAMSRGFQVTMATRGKGVYYKNKLPAQSVDRDL